MMNDDWQKPSEALRRIAEGKVTPTMERCPSCEHTVHDGPCGYPTCDCGRRRR